MSRFNIPTQPGTNQSHKTISIDSGHVLKSGLGDIDCSFSCTLEEKIALTGKTRVFLSSIYISSYKLNETSQTLWGDNTVQSFNFEIPQFETRNVAGNAGGGPTTSNRRFSLPNENGHLPGQGGDLSENDFKPFVLGHLGQQAVYVSTIQAKAITRIDVKVTDQDGKSIYKSSPANIVNVNANPPTDSRRVMMQFILVSDS